MPQNAHIVASGGDYTTIIAWEAGEQDSDYGSVTVGRVDGFFDQGSTSLIIAGTWTNGARLEPFDGADGFDGTERKLCGLTTANTTRGIDFVAATNIDIDGLEIYYTGGSGTDRTLEDSGAGVFTLSNALIKTEGNKRTWLGNFVFIDSVIATTATTNNVSTGTNSTFTRCNFFSASNAGSGGLNQSTSLDTVSICLNTTSFSGGSSSDTNCASDDGTATAFPNIVVADNFESATPLTSGDYRIKSGSILDTNGIGAFIQSAGGITVTATLGTINYASQNATVQLTGSVDVIATLGLISYTSQNTTIQLSGEIDVSATLGAINYSSQNTTVQLSGAINVNAGLGTITYTSQDAVVQLSGEIIANATLGLISYSSNDAVVSLTSDIAVTATLGTIDYSSQNTTVTLQGEIVIPVTLGQISYDSNNVIVGIGEGQIIGVVTAGFADDLYSSGFKPDEITVTFKT